MCPRFFWFFHLQPRNSTTKTIEFLIGGLWELENPTTQNGRMNGHDIHRGPPKCPWCWIFWERLGEWSILVSQPGAKCGGTFGRFPTRCIEWIVMKGNEQSIFSFWFPPKNIPKCLRHDEEMDIRRFLDQEPWETHPYRCRLRFSCEGNGTRTSWGSLTLDSVEWF